MLLVSSDMTYNRSNTTMELDLESGLIQLKRGCAVRDFEWFEMLKVILLLTIGQLRN